MCVYLDCIYVPFCSNVNMLIFVAGVKTHSLFIGLSGQYITSTSLHRTTGPLSSECYGARLRRIFVHFDRDRSSNDLSMMTSLNGNIIRVTGPLCGEFTGDR